jgi:large subunit ribosomal protein L21
MYAVFKFGGRQHKAGIGDVLSVQKVDGEVGNKFEIDQILMVRKDDGLMMGTPTVDGAKVFAEILQQGRDKKILVQKFKRRKKYRRKAGHRQQMTRIKITDVVVP